MNKLLLQILTLALLISACLSIQQNKRSHNRHNNNAISSNKTNSTTNSTLDGHDSLNVTISFNKTVSFNSTAFVNSTLVSINSTLSTINSTLSTIDFALGSINHTLSAINGTLTWNETVSLNSTVFHINSTLVSINATLSHINSTLGSLNSTISSNGTISFNGTLTVPMNSTAFINSTLVSINSTLASIDIIFKSINETLYSINSTLTWNQTVSFNETSLNTSIPYYTFQPFYDSKCMVSGGGIGVAISQNQQNITVFNQTNICANFNLTSSYNFTVQYFENNCTQFANQSIHNETFVISECTYSPFLKSYYSIDLSTVKLPQSTLVVNFFNKTNCLDINQEGFNYMHNHTIINHKTKPHFVTTSLLFCNEQNVATNKTCTTHNHKQHCITEPATQTCDESRNYKLTCA